MTDLMRVVYIVRLLRIDILLYLSIIAYSRDRVEAIVSADQWPSVITEECSRGNRNVEIVIREKRELDAC
ncbi:hypothetical protein EVAR_62746_1 [Eumeta japonica]|uniref:Uncharacterized protein n=1 Tax=Eumeta variegata TaxID=151549 RepID=A0A4C1Z984_EUMVA|nr:hypothetical protein EVAR_62746_1 [Eumeta japonica]